MRNRRLTRVLAMGWLCVGILALLAPAAQAAPITFAFVFRSAGGPAQATGVITYNQSPLDDPSQCLYGDVSRSEIRDLRVTVTGASSGNGTFGLGDFRGVTFCANGAHFDLSTNLVGQPTDQDPWGTPTEGAGGDFNLFGPPPTPNGEWWFTLCANGGDADCMELVSMEVRPPSPAPALDPQATAAALLLLLVTGAVALRRRRSVHRE